MKMLIMYYCLPVVCCAINFVKITAAEVKDILYTRSVFSGYRYC